MGLAEKRRRHRFIAKGKGQSRSDVAAEKARILWDLSHDKDLIISWKPFREFCEANAYWLDDYALFRSIRDFFKGRPWTEWPDDIRRHEPEALKRYAKELAGTVSHVKFMQYIFDRQWHELRSYAKKMASPSSVTAHVRRPRQCRLLGPSGPVRPR